MPLRVTCALLLGHMLGDFVLQSNEVARAKLDGRAGLFRHCALYAVGMFAGSLFGFSLTTAVLATILLSGAHALIDVITVQVLSSTREKDGHLLLPSSGQRSLRIFVIDQAAHVLTILIFAKAICLWACPVAVGAALWRLMEISASYDSVLVVATLVVFCWQPCSVFVKKILEAVKPAPAAWGFDATSVDSGKAPEGPETNEQKAGRVIGVLERLVILILGLTGTFTAIGIVVAVKGLARFKQFEDQDFAESFLVGTLSSVLLALLAVFVGNALLA